MDVGELALNVESEDGGQLGKTPFVDTFERQICFYMIRNTALSRAVSSIGTISGMHRNNKRGCSCSASRPELQNTGMHYQRWYFSTYDVLGLWGTNPRYINHDPCVADADNAFGSQAGTAHQTLTTSQSFSLSKRLRSSQSIAQVRFLFGSRTTITMLVNQLSALLAAIPMAAALDVRGGPGGWHGGGRGGHGPHPDEPFSFRIVTYDPAYQITKEYFTAGREDDNQYPLIQTPDVDESGVFEVTKDRYLVYTSADGTTLGPLIANYLSPLSGDGPWPLLFATAEEIEDNSLTEWKWVADYEDYTLKLYRPDASDPYYLLLCDVDDEVLLFVGEERNTYLPNCVATHLDIEPVDEYF